MLIRGGFRPAVARIGMCRIGGRRRIMWNAIAVLLRGGRPGRGSSNRVGFLGAMRTADEYERYDKKNGQYDGPPEGLHPVDRYNMLLALDVVSIAQVRPGPRCGQARARGLSALPKRERVRHTAGNVKAI